MDFKWKKPLLDRCKDELRKYNDLVKNETNDEKRKCYVKFRNTLKKLINATQ